MAEHKPPGGSDIGAGDQVGEVEQLDRGFVLDIGLDHHEFEATPDPWYRSPRAVTAIGAIVVAVVALTVSAVLLVARTPAPAQSVEPTVAGDESTSSAVVTTTPLTAAPVATSIEAPPPEATFVESEESEESDVVEPVTHEPAVPAVTAEPSGNPTTVEAPTAVIRVPVTRTQISVLPPR